MKKNKLSLNMVLGISIAAGAILLVVLFFHKSLFSNFSILGIDGAYSSRMVVSDFVKNGFTKVWSIHTWLGFKLNTVYVSIYTLFQKLMSPEISLTLSYTVSIALSLIFSYIFLCKLKLRNLASIFGAIAYSFTPHIISLIYAGHILAVDMLPYPPMLFYFLTIAFDKDNTDKLKMVLGLVLSGVAWGLMLGDEAQRGLYFSVAASGYIIFLIFQSMEVNIKTFFKDVFANKKFWFASIKVLLIGVFLLATFSNGLKSGLNLLKQRSDREKIANNSQTESKQSKDEKWAFATSWSMNPAELADSLAFGYHGTISGDKDKPYWGTKPYSGNSEAIGFFVLIFAIIGIILSYKKKPIIRFFMWTGIVALLLSFGRFFGGFPLFGLWFHLPMMSKMRVPAKFIAVFAFAFSMLAGFGLNSIIELINNKDEDSKRKLNIIFKASLIFLAVGLIWWIAVAAGASSIRDGFASKFGGYKIAKLMHKNMNIALLRMNVFIVLTVGLFFIGYKFKDKAKMQYFIAIPFILFMIVDLWSIDLFFVNKSYFKPKEFYQPDGVVDFLQNDSDVYRVVTSLKAVNRGNMMPLPTTATRGHYLTYIFSYYDIEALDVPASSAVDTIYNSFFVNALQAKASLVQATNVMQFLDQKINANIRLLRLANVKYLITDGRLYGFQQPLPLYNALTNHKDVYQTNVALGYGNRQQAIFAIKDTLPRIGFYQNYVSVTNNDEALNYIGSMSFDIQDAVVIKSDTPSKIGDKNPVMPILMDEYKPWYSKADFDAPSDGIVLFNIKHDEDWSVYIDGKESELLQVNYIMQGVFLPKGKHTIEFKFAQKSNTPFFVSLFTVLFGILLSILFGVYKLITGLKVEK